ncbi:MAG: flagellar hook-associated protein FlgK [Oscillospiraceae bacterium]
MRSTFIGMETARSAIVVNQLAQDVIANNLANSGTAGYTRQRVERTSVAVSSYSSRVSSSSMGNTGTGVAALGVSQIRDSFLDKSFRDQYSVSSGFSQTTDILSDILSVFPDGADITDDSGLLGGLEGLYKNLNTFIQSPTSQSEANLVKSSFTNITQILKQLDSGLTTVCQRQTENLQSSVSRTNDLLEQIANLNKSIAGDASVMSNSQSKYFAPNELLDQRNLLLDELASYGNINVTNNNDGTVSVEMGGRTVVDKGDCDSLSMNVDKNNYVDVVWRTTGDSVSMTGGSISAYVNVINGRGSNVQSNSETPTQGIPYYRDRLNTFASALADIANTTIPATVDASGKATSYKTLLSGFNSDGTKAAKVTAGNIAISSEWSSSGAGYIVYSKSENVEDYAQLLSNRIFKDSTTFNSYGESYTGTFSNYTIEMLGKIGTDVSFNKGRSEATSTIADDYLSKRDSTSGVQQDEETSNMLIYQKSYQAAARLMTVMDDMLDTLINGMGRVGR